MRALLVSYAEIGVNSTSHVLGFARGLAAVGWDVNVAVLRTVRYEEGFRFFRCDAVDLSPVAASEVLPVEIVHLWTTRGAIWHFLKTHRELIGGALIVHLEDDEGEIVRALSGGRKMNRSWWEPDGMERRGLGHLSHPVLGRCLLGCADGVTILSPELLSEAPMGVPAMRVLPPLGAIWLDEKLRPVVPPVERYTIVYAGGVHSAVEADFHALCSAVGILVQSGIPVRLVRSGPPGLPPKLISQGARLSRCFEDLGYLSEEALEQLLRTATVLVQPGRPSDFNRRRLPAKLLPYLASGTPVVMPSCYGWLGIKHGEHAWMYEDGTPKEIAMAIQSVIEQPRFAREMAERAARWARQVFNPRASGEKLAAFYQEVLAQPRDLAWNRLTRPAVQLPFWLAAHPERASRVAPTALRGYAVAVETRSRTAPVAFTFQDGPLVSVVIPCFNHRRFLPERMKSVFDQTYRKIEIVFLDDGSSDGSVSYVQGLSSPFPIRIVVNERNSGRIFQQWHRGVLEAAGEFVWIAESDDSCDPNLVERLVRAGSFSRRIGLAYTQSKVIDEFGHDIGSCLEDTQEIDASRWSTDFLNSGTDEVRKYLVIRNTIPNASACLFRREALLGADLPSISLRVCGDWLAYARIAERYDIAFVAEPLNRYRRHPETARSRSSQDGTIIKEMYSVQNYICRRFEVSAEHREAAAEATIAQLAYLLKSNTDRAFNFVDELEISKSIAAVDSKFCRRLADQLGHRHQPDLKCTIIGITSAEVRLHSWRWTRSAVNIIGNIISLNFDQPGFVSLRDLCVKNARTGEIVWRADSPAGYRAIAVKGGTIRLGNANALDLLVLQKAISLELPTSHEFLGSDGWELTFETRKGAVPLSLDNFVRQSPRVLMLVPHLEMGGADRFNLDLIHQLSKRFGWNFTLASTCRSADRWSQEFVDSVQEVFQLHHFLAREEYPEFLEFLIESRQPEVVLIGHSLFGYEMARWIRGRFPGLAVMDLVHIATEDWRQGGYPRMTVNNRVYIDRTICTSINLCEWLVRRGVDRQSVDVVYTNVDTEKWRRTPESAKSARRTWGIPDSQTVILFSGRLCDQKQSKLLPLILNRLLDLGRDVNLVVAGDGPDWHWLEAHLAATYPFNSRMLGALSTRSLQEVMCISDLLVLPSKNEGIALTLFEALSMRVVPVATDVGGQAELVTPEIGVLVRNTPNMVEELVTRLDELLRSAAKRAAFADAGRRHIEALYSINSMGDALQSSILKGIVEHASKTSISVGLSEVELDECAKAAVRALQVEEKERAVWNSKLRGGKSFPRAVSAVADWLRNVPVLGLLARALENQYGNQIGRFIMRWV